MTGLAASAVADAARWFDSWLAFRQRYDRVPGVQAAILHGDHLVLDTAHGWADVERGVPLGNRHLFRIASHSKTFTATVTMQLVEQGRLRLDDTAAHWLPHLVGAPLGDVTVRELLSHAAGIVRDSWDGDFWQLARAFPDEAGLQQMSLDDAAVISRNVQFKYSNVGYSMVGEIIEAVTGQPYRSVVVEHVVDRLGLADTGPDLDPERLGEYAVGYSARSYADRRIPIEHVDTGAMSSATGFFSTAADVVRYASAHFAGDGRLLTDESKRMMQRAEWKVEGADSSYGLGFAIADIGKRRVLGHGGGYPGHITRTFFDPVDQLAVSVLTNSIDGPALGWATAAIRLIDRAASSVPDSSEIPLSSFEGRFANLWGAFDIVALGGRLYQLDPTLPDPALDPTQLEVVDEHTLRITKTSGYGSPGERIAFDRDDDGVVRSVRGGSATSYSFELIADAVAHRDEITLGASLRPIER